VKTYLAKDRRGSIRWRLVDANGCVLGRLAARVARELMGKSSPDYTPHADHRDGVIIINAEKIRLTGKKLDQKVYHHYTGYPGGLRELSARKAMETKPEWVIREAVRGMLPKTHRGDQLATRLRVYVGATHPHSAQNPETISLGR
jgi:large subunit ribosomal protein L13